MCGHVSFLPREKTTRDYRRCMSEATSSRIVCEKISVYGCVKNASNARFVGWYRQFSLASELQSYFLDGRRLCEVKSNMSGETSGFDVYTCTFEIEGLGVEDNLEAWPVFLSFSAHIVWGDMRSRGTGCGEVRKGSLYMGAETVFIVSYLSVVLSWGGGCKDESHA